MPLLDTDGSTATVVCASCENEWSVSPADWTPAEDGSTFGASPCPSCGAQEWFAWSDWVYVSSVGGRRAPRAEPDPNHFGAQQMVLIERVARATGRQQVRTDKPAGRAYPRAPRAPRADEVRAYTRALKGRA